jgi:hypothetical protein
MSIKMIYSFIQLAVIQLIEYAKTLDFMYDYVSKCYTACCPLKEYCKSDWVTID